MLRYRTAVVFAVALSVIAVARAEDLPPINEPPSKSSSSPETWPFDWPTASVDEWTDGSNPAPAEEFEYNAGSGWSADTVDPSNDHWPSLKWLGLRHSDTHGRHVGRGQPLIGTSWRNRPYYIGGDLGTLWFTNSVDDDITRDVDMFGGVFAGCDWDHYWGTELAVHRATPELINRENRDADRGDRLMLWTASMMYYPWGDSVFRPYWRCGVGLTEIDYPTADGDRRDEGLWTIPVGVGVKYPVRRWLAARAELTDQLALGNHDISTLHNLSLTFGLEWRFGAHPPSYWPWNPSRHIW